MKGLKKASSTRNEPMAIPSGMAMAEAIRKLTTIRSTLAPFTAACSEIDWVIVREAATGDVVMNERIDRFHFPNGWLELPVAGVFEVRDGRIVLWRDYFDLATFTAARAGLG